MLSFCFFFFFSSRRRHTRWTGDWSSDVCSSDLRDVIRNFNADGFGSLYPRYKGGRPPKFTLPQRREIKKIAKSRPADHGLPFSTWSLSKLAEFLVAEGVIDDISHEGLRALLREEGVTFQRLKTWPPPTRTMR